MQVRLERAMRHHYTITPETTASLARFAATSTVATRRLGAEKWFSGSACVGDTAKSWSEEAVLCVRFSDGDE